MRDMDRRWDFNPEQGFKVWAPTLNQALLTSMHEKNVHHQWAVGYYVKILTGVTLKGSKVATSYLCSACGELWEIFLGVRFHCLLKFCILFLFKSHITSNKPTVNFDKRRGASCLRTGAVTLATGRVTLCYVEARACCCLRFTTDQR